MTYTYGDKQLLVHQDGTFSVFSGGRELAKTYVWIATKYKGHSNINIPRVTGKYDETRMHVRNIKIQNECITVEGLLPWNSPGEESLNATWSISFIPKNKAQIHCLLSIHAACRA